MATIQEGSAPITLINVFTVTPEKQKDVIRLIEEATEQVIRHLPGFVSTSLHASMDGTHVVNYAQWETQENLQAMLGDPEAGKHLQAIMQQVSSADPQVYAVSKVIDNG